MTVTLCAGCVLANTRPHQLYTYMSPQHQLYKKVHCGACSGDTLAFTLHLPPLTNIHHTHYYLLCCSAHWLQSCSSFNQPLTQPQGTVTCTLLCSSLHTLSLHTTSYCYRWWQHINRFGHWTGSWGVLSHNTSYRPLTAHDCM